MKETRLTERQALAQVEQNNNTEEVNKTRSEGVTAEESEVDRTLESEPGWTTPGPFEPAPEPRKSPTGVEKKVVMFPAMDARMVTDSAMKIEIAM